MLSAKLKYVITIETPTQTKDGRGNIVNTWATLGTRRSDIQHNWGKKVVESDTSGQVHYYNDTFTFRHIASLTLNCRIVFESNVYEIQDIETLRRRWGFRVITKRAENV